MSFHIALDDHVVPWLCEGQRECSADGFMDWPSRYHFDVDEFIARGSNHPKGFDLFAAFLQGWLFFGLLRTVLAPSGINVNVDDFLISEDPDHDSETLDNQEEDHEPSEDASFLVDTTNLSLYTLYWISKETHIHDEERSELIWSSHAATFSKVNSVLNKLILWRREFYPLHDDEATEPPVVDSVILSIILLSEYLLYACEKIFNKQGELTLEWDLDNALRWRLLCAGWCPGEIAMLEKKMIHSTSMYLLGTWDRLFLTKDHTKCTEEVCLANNIDESIYETKHVSPDCQCKHQGQNDGTPTAIAGILASGSIPVIQIASSGEDMIISVKKSTQTPYVAISHVWSDGLGNPGNNTLPGCQLRRLQNYVNGLYPDQSQPTSFWIDTICVPREMGLRKKAIRLMAQTYRDSDKVLVIDSWLRQTGFTGHPSLDLLIVKACTWGDRLWTLQESVLATRDQVHFQTDNGPVAEGDLYKTEEMRQKGVQFMANLIGTEDDTLQETQPEAASAMLRALERSSEIYENEVKHPLPWDYSDISVSPDPEFPWREDCDTLQMAMGWSFDFVFVEARDHFQEMRWPGGGGGLNDNPMLAANTILITGECMRFRTTSHLEDEPICFATLIGQDPTDVLNQKTIEARMRVVASKMKHVPAQILFSPRPRIDVDGLRWAPLSFRSTTVGKGYSPGVAMATVAEVVSDGLLMKLDGIVLGFDTGEMLSQEFLVTCNSAFLSIRQNGTITYPRNKSDGTALALLIRKNFDPFSQARVDSVLVEIQQEKDDVFLTRLLAHYFIGPFNGTATTDVQETTGRFVQGQRWCVG